MKIGKFRERIDVYSQSLVVDSVGGFTENYTLKGSCWSRIEDRSWSSDERYTQRQLKDIASFKLTTRQNIGFSFESTDIIKLGTRTFRIQGHSDIQERGFGFALNCREIEGDVVAVETQKILTVTGNNIFTITGNEVFVA